MHSSCQISKTSYHVAMKLLVSCCNEDGGLFTVDTEAPPSEQVFRQTPKHYTSGRTGLTSNGNIIYSSGPSDIYSYKWENNQLHQLEHWSGFDGWDIHDIKYYKDHLYIVQTGGNCIAKIPTSGEQTLEVVWQVDPRNDQDHIHLNSLQLAYHGCATRKPVLYVSRFTEDKKGRPWGEVVGEGRILILDTTGHIHPLENKLSHPHSLIIDTDGRLKCLDSFTKKLKSLYASKTEEYIENITEGYPRGLLATEDFYYVGNSKTTNHQGVNSKLDSPSVIEISKKTLKKIREFIIPDAIEIYDIIQLPQEN